ncbi:MAG: hypothetical protein CMP79_06215 [Formosa sp.]|nr:hypothetical protein [Formosa sp.]
MKKLLTIMSLAFVGFTFGQEEEPKFNVTGSVDAYFRANLTSGNTGDANTVLGTGDYSIFNNDSGFSAGLANVTLSYEGETVGFIADLAYGPRMDAWNSGEVVNEAYMYWNASDKVKLMMGRFNSWMGYERLSAANNFHYSMSHMYSYSARNFNGLVAQFDLGTDLRAGVGVMNQVNDLDGNTGKFSVAAGLTYKETTSVSFASSDEQSFIDFKTAFDVSDNFNVKLNAHIANFGDDMFGYLPSVSAIVGSDVYLGESFTSISAYPQIKSSDNMSWGMRLEYMMIDDKGAFADGLNVFTPTLTARYSVGDLTIIPELRLDSASEDVFNDNDGEATGGLTAFNLAMVYTF